MQNAKQRILIIDDDKLMCLALAKILIAAGYEVEVAEDGDVGIRMQRTRAFDLVITDLIMPEKEGIEIIRELRKENNRLPVIAISAGGRRGSAADYLKWARLMGAKKCLSKPIKREELLDAVATVLSEP